MRILRYSFLVALFVASASSFAQDSQPVKQHHTLYSSYNHILMQNRKDKTADRVKYPYNGFSIGYEYGRKLLTKTDLYFNVGAEINWQYYSRTFDDYEKLDNSSINIVDPATHTKFIYPVEILAKIGNENEKINFGGIRVPFSVSYEFYSRNGKWTFAPFMGGHIQVNFKATYHETYDLTIKRITLLTPSIMEQDTFDELVGEQEHVDEKANLISNEYYGDISLKRLFYGWQVGMKVQYGHCGLGFIYENEVSRIAGRFTTDTYRTFISYTF